MSLFFLTLFSTLIFAQVPHSGSKNAVHVKAVNENAHSAPDRAAGAAVDAILTEDLIRSLRDPFQVPSELLAKKEKVQSELETYQLKDIKLNGVIVGKKTRAMVSTPSGKVFFVHIGDRLGDREGKISQIEQDSIKIVEYFTDERGKKLPDIYQITMGGDLVSLSTKEN